MKLAGQYLRWFVIGMGQVMGISHSAPRAHAQVTEMEAIAGDFGAVGSDFRNVIARNPVDRLKSKQLQQAGQLELAGIS
ncbi:MAG: hypothetical protein M3119_00300 [Verrucomicrobiota bacterium]|nr:hypothetical protein [Verrucomicrobiota bacterium]